MLQGIHDPVKLLRIEITFRKLKLVFFQYIILDLPLNPIPTS
jgi:hypothetical protein